MGWTGQNFESSVRSAYRTLRNFWPESSENIRKDKRPRISLRAMQLPNPEGLKPASCAAEESRPGRR